MHGHRALLTVVTALLVMHPFAAVQAVSRCTGAVPGALPGGNGVARWGAGGIQKRLQIGFSQGCEPRAILVSRDEVPFRHGCDVEQPEDDPGWRTACPETRFDGGKSIAPIPEPGVRNLLFPPHVSGGRRVYGLSGPDAQDVAVSESPIMRFSAIARSALPGSYPRYLAGEQTYWTIVGVSGDSREALINTDGAIEVDKESFSLEPFLYLKNRLVTWNDVTTEVSLDDGYLPVPSVVWKAGTVSLTVRALASGRSGRSTLVATYTVRNTGPNESRGRLFVAVRPFQVNPPWQALNVAGGVAPVDRIENEDGLVIVNDTKRIIPLESPDGFGATTHDAGDISEYLRRGALPSRNRVRDPAGYASAAFAYTFRLRPGASREVSFVVPFHEAHAGLAAMRGPRARAFVQGELETVRRYWHTRLDRVNISLPGESQEIIRTLKSNIAYILINRDGPAIQPGSRAYERAWIRDGSLTSMALLEMGIQDEVKEYIDWYAQYQYPSGKIPCAVDTRGADPVPEHDSHGEFIFAVMQYFRFTRDTAWLRTKLDHVVRTVSYLQGLRRERMTDEYRAGPPDRRVLYGLVPESISHEGYSASAKHSYWDNLFGILGLKDAAAMAHVLGMDSLVMAWRSELADYRASLYSSMHLAMTMKNIDYIPGCAELGDFDASSTSVGISPCGELGRIPEPALHNTFERYYRFFTDRRDGRFDWNDYTLSETRTIGTFVYLDQKRRAHEATDFFLQGRRPAGWNLWAEVVWRNPATPRFIGDMPHTRVGSDFIRAVRGMLAHEREHDSSLVIGAGIPEPWVTHPDGIEVRSLPTAYGLLGFTMRNEGEEVRVQLGGTVVLPPGKIILRSPRDLPLRAVAVDGVAYSDFTPTEVKLDRVPADVVLRYGQ